MLGIHEALDEKPDELVEGIVQKVGPYPPRPAGRTNRRSGCTWHPLRLFVAANRTFDRPHPRLFPLGFGFGDFSAFSGRELGLALGLADQVGVAGDDDGASAVGVGLGDVGVGVGVATSSALQPTVTGPESMQ